MLDSCRCGVANMCSCYAIKNVVFESGERFPFLVNSCTGIPVFDATVFSITEFMA